MEQVREGGKRANGVAREARRMDPQPTVLRYYLLLPDSLGQLEITGC